MKSSDQQPVARRTLLAGAGTVGALAAAATLLPGRKTTPIASAESVQTASADDHSGYRLTEHVKQYYRTARV